MKPLPWLQAGVMSRVRQKGTAAEPVPTPPAVTLEPRLEPPTPRGGRLRRLASSRLLQSVVAAAAYAGFAIYLTWPLAVDLDSRIYGAVGDLTGVISVHRELVDSGQFPFLPGTLHDFNAPDGLDVRWTLNIVTLLSFGTVYVLSLLFGPVAAVGIHTLLGFTLSGLAMFLLVRRLVGHAGVAFIAGYAYAFYPLVVVKAQGHIDYVHGWVLVLAAWRMIELIERPTNRNGVLAGAALLVAFVWTPYHILFAGVMALALAAVALFFAWRRRLLLPTLRALSIAGSIAIVWLAGMALLDRAGPRSEQRARTIDEAIAYSARAEEYVIPTSEHPLFGEPAGKYRASHLHGSNSSENTLYVGVTLLLLAALGLVMAIRQGGAARRAAIAAAALLVAGFACSAPPRVDLFGVEFPTTTELIFDVTTSWRVFSRLVVVVMVGVVLLAAMGMTSIIRRRPTAIQGALLVGILAVVAADLWTARPAHGTNKIAVPPTYLKLAKMPRGIAAEYPLVLAEQSGYADVFYQGWHHKPILNGYYPGTPEENRALQLSDLSDPATARGLNALGVRYVLVRQDLKTPGLPGPGWAAREFHLVAGDSFIRLYELTLPGPHVLVTPAEGFAAPEGPPHQRFQWLLEPEGTLEIRGSCSPCEGVVKMTVGSFARQRDVIVRDGGRVLSRARVGDTKVLRLRVRFERKLTLQIQTDPGPQSIASTTGSSDTRSVGISVRRESFRFDGSTRR